MGPNFEKCSCFYDYLKPVCKLWAILTTICLWGIGIEVTYHGNILGVYAIVVAIFLTFFETTWVVNIFLGVCIRDETHPFLRCWEVVLWFDLWKKSIVYLAAACVLFINPQRFLLDIGGAMLIFLAILYALIWYVMFRFQSKDSLLRYEEHPYSRFEEINHDDIDDTLPEIVPTETVADQPEILTI